MITRFDPQMSPHRARTALDLFKRARPLSAGERREVLARGCGGDDGLRAEVEDMLRFDDRTSGDGEADGVSAAARRLMESVAREAGAETAVPSRIGQYEIVRLLGVGGMGVVYEAQQETPRRRVALKMLRADSMTEERCRRFAREAEVLGRLKHPGIAQIYEAGTVTLEHGQRPFLAMELVDGSDLLEHCERQVASHESRLALLATVADAVQHAHERGVIHRDLKPENILVEADGRPKILDFGVAHVAGPEVVRATTLTRSGELVGTVAFMSPEQLRGDPSSVTATADVYALGVLAYELLAGRLPIALDGHSLVDAVRIVETTEPVILGAIDPRLRGDPEVIVAKALEKRPGRRYPNAGGFADDIRRCLRHEPIQARRPTVLYQLRKFARRHRALVASFCAIIMTLVAGLIGVDRARNRERVAAELANRQLYRTAIRAANYALNLHDVASALTHLQSVPNIARGWEWHHVHRQIEPWVFDYAIESPVGPPAYVDGGLVAFAHADGHVSLCDPEHGSVVRVLESDEVLHGLARSQPPGRVVAGTEDGNVVIWQLDSGARTMLPTSGGWPVRTTDVARDGTIVARADGRAAVLRAGAKPRVFEDMNASVWMPDLVVSPNGRELAVLEFVPGLTGYESRVGFWDLASMQRLGVFEWGAAPSCLAFDPQGELLAIGNRQRDIVLLDAGTLELVADMLGHAGKVTSVAFSPDGSLLVSSSNDGTMRIWDVAQQKQVGVLWHGWEEARAVIDPHGRSVTVCAANGSGARCYLLRPAGATVLFGHESYTYSVDFSPRGDLVASAGFRFMDRSIRLWDPIEGTLVDTLREASADSWAVFSADGRSLVFRPEERGHAQAAPISTGVLGEPTSDDVGFEARILYAPSDEWLKSLRARVGSGRPLSVAGAALTSDDSLVATRIDEHRIILRRGVGGAVLATLEGSELYGSPAIGPDGRLVAAASADHGVYLWDWVGGDARRLRGHSDDVYAVAFSPDGRMLATGGNDSRILLWDVDTWEVCLELLGHVSYVHSLSWSPDGTQLASASGDSTVRIWDSATVAQRHRQALASRRLQALVRARVESVWKECRHDGARALAQLDAESWTTDQRRAAERVLLELRSRR